MKIYASDIAKLDSSVINGGGTDVTDLLQAVLDKAPEYGRLHLIMDGAALVRGLKVHDNTTIECMDKSCGFYLADNSDCAVLFTVAYFFIAVIFGTLSKRDFVFSRPFNSYIFSIACVLSAVHPIPKTVSVGNITISPFKRCPIMVSMFSRVG